MKLLIAEPLVKNPVRSPLENIRTELGVRLSSLYLAGFARGKVPGLDIKVQENRLRQEKKNPYSLEDEINNSDIVAIGAVSTEFSDAINILRIAKEKGKKTIIGGIFATSNTEFVLSTGVVDYVVRNEGERTLVELLNFIGGRGRLENIEGISYLNKLGKIVENPIRKMISSLDNIFPAYDLISLKDYVTYERGPIYTARGCPNKCTFCSIPKHWAGRYRESSIETIKDNIETYVNAGFDSINFKDESVTANRKRAVEIFTHLRDKSYNVGGNNLTYKIKSRLDGFDSDLLKLMKSAGVEIIQIGIESISDERLNEMKKGINAYDIKKQLDLVLENEIKINPIFIIGYENQTPDDLKRDMDFAYQLGNRNNVQNYFTFNTPHPGTHQWNNSSANGLRIVSTNLNNYNHKRIVAIPSSLGDVEQGLELMSSAYREIVEGVDAKRDNPTLDLSYLFKENSNLKHKKNIEW